MVIVEMGRRFKGFNIVSSYRAVCFLTQIVLSIAPRFFKAIFVIYYQLCLERYNVYVNMYMYLVLIMDTAASIQSLG